MMCSIANGQPQADHKFLSAGDDVPIGAETLDKLLAACMRHPPETADVELIRVHERPAKPIDVIEAETRQRLSNLKSPTGDGHDESANARFEAEVRELKAWYAAPIVDHQRFQIRGQSRRLDSVTNEPGTLITSTSPFETTWIIPGDPSQGDGRYFHYSHWKNNDAKRDDYAAFGPGSASRSDFNRTQWVRDIREELLGIERLLLDILAVEACELPKPPLTRAPEARDLPLDRKKIESLLADEGNIRLRVQEFEADGEKRLRIRFLSPKGWGIVAVKELTPFAEIVVKANDFRAVYEQRLLDDKGKETVVVTADGFDSSGIPREKKWVRRRPDGDYETTSYAIFNAKVNIDIPASEFEFNPPEGYLVDVMGPDGRPIKSDAPPAPALDKKPIGNRLFNLNALAVLALVAFTLRKLWLRRPAAAAR